MDVELAQGAVWGGPWPAGASACRCSPGLAFLQGPAEEGRHRDLSPLGVQFPGLGELFSSFSPSPPGGTRKLGGFNASSLRVAEKPGSGSGCPGRSEGVPLLCFALFQERDINSLYDVSRMYVDPSEISPSMVRCHPSHSHHDLVPKRTWSPPHALPPTEHGKGT